MILLLLSFIAGVLTVLAPCTLALLPVIVGGSISEGRNVRRAVTVTASLGVSVVAFTLLLKASTAFINVPESFWQILSGVIIVLLGVTMVFPSLYDRMPWVRNVNQEGNKLLGVGYTKKNFWGDVIMGAALGPVFSSCSPTYFLILATVLPRSLGAGVVYLLAYAIGLSGALLVVAFAGQKLLAKFGLASDPNGWIKRTIGIIFIIIGVAISFGYDKKLEGSVTNAGFFNVTNIETKLLTKELPSAPSTGTPAPEITDPSGFINTGGVPVTIGQFKGKKAVLIDFWTYSCINCLRTVPFIEAVNAKYSSQGLEVISIHTPEFAFEHVLANVQAAVTKLGITYPVVLDNDYGTWNAFGNEYWPQQYLIDINGNIVYSHSGEGDDAETEAAIQKALTQRDAALGLPDTVPTGTIDLGTPNIATADIESPETYFGSNRNEYLANGVQSAPGIQTLTLPSANDIAPNMLYLGGTWSFTPEYAAAAATGDQIEFQYHADDIYFVASSSDPNGTRVKVLLDGQPVPAAMQGADLAPDSTALIQGDRLYTLVTSPTSGTHTISITTLGTGLEAYTFTFG